jgi:hypothetical protein
LQLDAAGQPRQVSALALLIRGDGGFFGQREANLVQPVEQAVLPERVNLKRKRFAVACGVRV